MKNHSLLMFLVGLLVANIAKADQTLCYPEKSPLIVFKAPDDWKTQMKNHSLFVVSPDGGDVIVEVMLMDAARDDDAAAEKEAKSTVDRDFKNLKLTKTDASEANGLAVSLLGGEGEDSSGPAHINMALVKHPAAAHQILFSVIAAKESASKNGAAVGGMFNSLAAAPAKTQAKASAAGADQTFSYPDKAKPDFTVDFPADWKMETTSEGAYVESPDKLVAINLLFIDAADVGVAVESMKKKVGAKYQSIEWNGGSGPEVNKDEALGLTATFHNGLAVDEGVKYSVNFAQYVRKGGDKFLLLLCQEPLKALDKHGDAIEKIIKSIKAR